MVFLCLQMTLYCVGLAVLLAQFLFIVILNSALSRCNFENGVQVWYICRSWHISASGGRGVCDCEWAPAAAGRCAESGRYRRARRACAKPLTCCREVVEVERYSLKLGWTPDMY